MKLNYAIALYTGKAAGFTSRLLSLGGGSTLPGRIARKLNKGFIPAAVRDLPHGCILITGTNGKTTTSTLLALILGNAGLEPIHNKTGANLMAGIASALIRDSDIKGGIDAQTGLFEVDEAAFPLAVADTSPVVAVVNNLFRDQLDRYGELNALAKKIKSGIGQLKPGSTIILNADDPLVAYLGQGIEQQVVYYGIETDRYTTGSPQHAADSKSCPACGSPLEYDYYLFGHMGKYRCPSCGFKRPVPDVSATGIETSGMKGTECKVNCMGEEISFFLPLPGIYNVYNALAATSAANAFRVKPETIVKSIEKFEAAFGRLEQFDFYGRRLIMILAKNPAGYNEVIRTLSSEPGKINAIMALNDNIADGRDVSWIWDVDFEMFEGHLEHVVCSGIRAGDMALRLKYAEVGESSMAVENKFEKALYAALEKTSEGDTLYVIPTYTAMLDLRKFLVVKGVADHFWES